MSAGESARALHDVGLDEIQAAARRIRDRIATTPMLSSRTAARLIERNHGIKLGDGPTADGAPRLFLKAEHLQVTGAFKARGALNRILTLDPDQAARGIITGSAGNHAQAVGWAASSAGIPAIVVMPESASRAKAEAAAGYGAHVELYGVDVGDAFARLEELRAERGLFFLHPFDDPAVIAGQGTVGLEIAAQLPMVDVVVAPVGGGGLISGVGAALKQTRTSVRIVGIEPEHSNALHLGIAAGEPVAIHPLSIADGLGAPFAGRWTIDLARRYVERVILVDEATIATGVAFALGRMKQLLEPAGAAALGAVLTGQVPLSAGETVCVIASGGNVDLDRLPGILAMAIDLFPGPAEPAAGP